MLIAVIKNGMVTAKLSVGDADSVVLLSSPNDANVYDLYVDGVFSANQNAASLKAADLKKRSIMMQIAGAQDDTAINALLASLDAQYNS